MNQNFTRNKVKHFRFYSILLVALLGCTRLIAQPMNGTYTIGATGTYSTFAAALADLASRGVNGPVTMQVQAGTYTVASSITIGTYAGVSATNPLVFDGGTASGTVLNGNIANAATVILNQCNYVTLKNLTINNSNAAACAGVGIVGSGATNAGTGTTVKRCIINLPSAAVQSAGILASTTTTGYGLNQQTGMDSITVDSNTITGSYYAVYFYGINATISNASNRAYKMRGNTLTNFYNTGFYLFYIQNGMDIINNTCTLATAAPTGYGIYSYYCYNHFAGNTPHRIHNNRFYNSFYSMMLNYMSSLTTNPTEIYNNTLIGRQTATNYGLYLFNATYSGSYNIFHNTVKNLDAINGYCMYYSNTLGGDLYCMNNIFAMAGNTTAGYYAVNFASAAGNFYVNNNTYYLGGASAPNLIFRGSVAYTTTTYQTSAGGGDSSKNVIPNFVAAYNDGHLADACNPKGSPTGSLYVPADRDGQARPSYPVIGSDQPLSLTNDMKADLLISPATPIATGTQNLVVRVKNVGSNTITAFNTAYSLNGGTPVVKPYTGPSLAPCDTARIVFSGTSQITLGATNFLKVYTYAPNSSTDADATNDTITAAMNAPLNGTYTIGTGGTYPTFAAAIADLVNGVSGPVTFQVLAGTYPVQVTINGPIAGASATNTVIFDGGTGNRASRIINAAIQNQGAVVLNGCKYVGFRNLTINNTATNSMGVNILGGISNNNGTGCFVNNCAINLPNSGTTISFGVFVNGATGTGMTNNFIDSISIDSNVINGGYYGIAIYGYNTGNPNYNRNHKIRGNTILPSYYAGIYTMYIYNPLDILNNTITFPASSTAGYGVYMANDNNSSGIATRVSGNKIEGASNGGLYLTFSTAGSGLEVYNNVISRLASNFSNGIYVNGPNLSNVKVLHNTVVMDNPLNAQNYGAFNGNLPVNSIVKNNIFALTAATGTGTPLYLTAGATGNNAVNNNIYYNVGNTGMVFKGSTLYTTSNYNTAAVGGDSSFNVNPNFVNNPTNLQVQTCYAGFDYTAIVPADINNIVRSVPPKIGAYESTTPLAYVSSNVIQNTGSVPPGAVDYAVLKIPVVLMGCGNGFTTKFYFNTTGTTSAADIVNAKIYSTQSTPVFNTSRLVGTVTAPSGPFAFTVSDSINRSGGDTVNYWLTYSVSATATASNLLDAKLDSMVILGSTRVPSNGNPAGNLVITPAMTYVGSTTLHPDLSTVQPSTTNNQLLKILVIGSSTGAPISVTQFNLKTLGGGNDAVNIANAKIWYTGNSSTFNAVTQFGSTYSTSIPASGSWSPYVISGVQTMANDTNYFWLTYDIKPGATLGDSVDAELTSVTVNSVVRTPAIQAPAGKRKIRAAYCPSAATQTADEEIWNVTFGTLNNTSNCLSTGGTGSALNKYSNYTALTPPDIGKGLTTTLSINASSCGGNFGSYLGVYIDYNQNGLLTDAGELVYNSGSFNSSTAGIIKTTPVIVPCSALTGNTLMRVVYSEAATLPAPCGTYGWGETEDYTINIVNVTPTYQASQALQVTGVVAPSTNDVPILRIPVKVISSDCNPGIITELRFNTAGTTTAADITAAKLYKTGAGNTFNTATLLGTVSPVSGQVVFSISDTVVNDTNNYWLAYNVSATAAVNNILDAGIDSIKVFGAWYIPATKSPAGNRVIAVPMTYVGSSTIHPDLSKVETSSINNRLLRIMVRTSTTGSPVNVTQFNLSAAGGGNDAINIASAKMWYTGNSPIFASTSQFGSTYSTSIPASGAWTPYVITGTQPLNNDTNYFWLTYDIKPGATIGDSVDAALASFVLAGNTQTPTVTAPAGNRRIRAPFCASAAYNNTYTDIGQLTITRGAATLLNNGTGCTPAISNVNGVKQYTDYSSLNPADLLQNTPYTINACIISGGTVSIASHLGVFIDYNQNGTFDVDEMAYASTATSTTALTGAFTIPCTALPGSTRMRVILQSNTVVTSACLSANTAYLYGETEDYTINIVNNPLAYVSSPAVQQTGFTSPGATDVSILRVPVKASGCGSGSITEMRFNIAGTTLASNITSARLYGTGNSTVFGTGNLLASVAAPTGQMVFTINEPLSGIDGDTNNFWLAYNISSSAGTTSNFVDARLDSVKVLGAYYVPAIGNPAGNKQITVPMTYISSAASHPDLSKIETGSFNNPILKIVINTSATGAPISVTNFNLSTAGSATPSVNIDNANIWYTGNSQVFSTATQFGATSYSPSGSYGVTGSQELVNGANVFWITYDVPAGANVGDSVDAVVSNATVDGISRTPTNGAPAGNRKIRAPYCTSYSQNTGDEDIFNVTLGTLNNTSTCTTTGGGTSVVQIYSDYRSLTPPDIATGLPTTLSVNAGSCGGSFNSFIGAYIDLNQNGSFLDAGELVYSSGAFTSSPTGIVKTGTIMLPCSASLGNTMMRIVYSETATVQAPCGTYGWGETEDYMVNIIQQPAAYTASTAAQITGSVSAGAVNAQVLRIPVKVIATQCLPGTLTQFNFNTTGTTSAANIVNAKLYATGSSNAFATTRLLGTVSAPSGQFSFVVADTAVNDTNNYWLTYDVSATATTGNLLDARIDSIKVFGSWYIPTNGNPAGNRIISAPMTYVSTTVTHPDLSAVQTNSTNNRMLCMKVLTSSTGAPIILTSFSLGTQGSTAAAGDITNAKVWYTGGSNTFATTTQFGTTTAGPNGTFAISGSQALLNDSNFFWLTYDVQSAATIGDSIDAQVNSMVIAGNTQIPAVTAPAGKRVIRNPYCPSVAAQTGDEEILNVTMGSLNNSSTCSTTGGPGSIVQRYSDYTGLAGPTVHAGDQVIVSVTRGTCGGFFGESIGVFIDWNQNGLLTDAGENAYVSAITMGTANQVTSALITVPSNVVPGTTRMRVVYAEATTASACGAYNWGETEDYTITIDPPLPPATYTWNGSVSTNYLTANNWTPARTYMNIGDKLIFGSGGNNYVFNIWSTNVRAIEVNNNTTLRMAGNITAAVLTTKDSLIIAAGSKIHTSTTTMALGNDVSSVGNLTGTGMVYGNLSRWLATGNANLGFPMADSNWVTRNVNLNFTTVPATPLPVTVAFTMGAPGVTGLPINDAVASVTADRAGINGYWTLTSTMAGATFTGNFNATGFYGVGNYLQLILMRRVNAASAWSLNGTHAATTGSNAAPVLNRTGMNAYGQFGVGGNNTVNPLPVSLLFFKATNLHGDVLLNWATANETDNKGFTIERSTDGDNFTDIDFVKGARNSKITLQYQREDAAAFAKARARTLYYRLRQEDNDGTIIYSAIATVNSSDVLSEQVKVYPNPFTENVGVSIESANGGEAGIKVYDITGNLVSEDLVQVKAGLSYHELKHAASLATGVYLVKVSLNGTTSTMKITKSN